MGRARNLLVLRRLQRVGCFAVGAFLAVAPAGWGRSPLTSPATSAVRSPAPLQSSVLPSLSGQTFFIGWGPLRSSVVTTWKSEGFTAAYKLIGDFDWRRVEPAPGKFDFRQWRSDAALLRSRGLSAFPSLEFLHPPAWFIAQHPHALEEFPPQAYPSGVAGDRLTQHCAGCADEQPSVSLGWLARQASENTDAWAQFRAYVTASVHAMAADPSVIGVSFPWMAFHGTEILGGWTQQRRRPASVLLGTFNPADLATWHGPGRPPANLADLEAGGTRLEDAWQAWTQQRAGSAFTDIASLLHKAAPSYWIAVDKFVWIRQRQTGANPEFALTAGLTETAFNDFFASVKKFVSQSRDHRIVFDDDGLTDSSKIPNYELTMHIIERLGLAFMGESQPGPSGINGLLRSVRTLKPTAVVFLPAPGGGGGWVSPTPDAVKTLCLVKTAYTSESCQR